MSRVTGFRSLCLGAVLAGAAGLVQAQQKEIPFGEAGEWAIAAAMTGVVLDWCTASRVIDGRAVYMRYDGTAWAFAVSVGPSDTLFIGFDIDGKTYPTDGGRDGDFAYVALDRTGLEAVRNGSLATLDFDGAAIKVPLNGTGAAALRVQDCVREDGVAPASAEFLVDPGPPVAESGPLGTDCPDRTAARSDWDGAEARLTLTANGAGPALQVFWVDPFGRLLPVPVVLGAPDAPVTLDAYEGQSFIVRDETGTCRGGLIRAGAGDGAIAIR